MPRLRSAYPTNYLTSGIAYAFHAHRDTWYSAPFCQINWWMPVWEIEERNCLAFHPAYFDNPVENSSEIYNYYEWNTKNRASAAQHVKSDTREQPKLTRPIEQRDLRILVPPGGLILFSAAQLHETVPNTSGVARYSIDFRTVHKGDAAARRGAANLDSRCTGTTMRDYLRASDLAAPAGRHRLALRRRHRDRRAQGAVRGRGGARRVEGTLALVTGATGRIGRAVGLALREGGEEVLLHGGRDPGRVWRAPRGDRHGDDGRRPDAAGGGRGDQGARRAARPPGRAHPRLRHLRALRRPGGAGADARREPRGPLRAAAGAAALPDRGAAAKWCS